MTTGYYCAIFPFCGGGKKKKKKKGKKTKAFYDWATTGIPLNSALAVVKIRPEKSYGIEPMTFAQPVQRSTN